MFIGSFCFVEGFYFVYRMVSFDVGVILESCLGFVKFIRFGVLVVIFFNFVDEVGFYFYLVEEGLEVLRGIYWLRLFWGFVVFLVDCLVGFGAWGVRFFVICIYLVGYIGVM